MLSYRHSFHAGNFADIIKHIVQVEILEHLIQKDKPFEYIDTHSGAGLFNLASVDAQKLEEHAGGILKIDPTAFPELGPYFEVIKSVNHSKGLVFYPGSPSIAKFFMRQQDRAWLYELHPQDFKRLCSNMGRSKRIKVLCDDGLKGLNSLLPPVSRRGLVFIDPSYEVKTEYDQVFDTVQKAYEKFATGIYAIWYPVVDRKRIERLERKFVQSGIKNIQRYEVGVLPDSEEGGMTASGIFVINPPWKLFETMSVLLPKLALALGASGSSKPLFKCDILADE